MLPSTSTPADACYLAALRLVAQIEARLAYGRPIIDKSGQHLHTLQEAVQAILDGRLQDSVCARTGTQ